MNKQRRKRLERISGELTRLYWELDEIQSEELEAFDNMPESLQYSERGLAMEEGLDLMDVWMQSIEETFNAIDEFVEV